MKVRSGGSNKVITIPVISVALGKISQTWMETDITKKKKCLYRTAMMFRKVSDNSLSMKTTNNQFIFTSDDMKIKFLSVSNIICCGEVQ